MSPEGKGEIRETPPEKYNELLPQISPDERCLAYQSDESGEEEIFSRSESGSLPTESTHYHHLTPTEDNCTRKHKEGRIPQKFRIFLIL
jgi:Tol biopolymer transport system component